MNILKMVKVYLKSHPWPDSPVKIGPGSCGEKCRKQHAYAEAVGQADMIEGEVIYSFVYTRPCNWHDRARGIRYG